MKERGEGIKIKERRKTPPTLTDINRDRLKERDRDGQRDRDRERDKRRNRKLQENFLATIIPLAHHLFPHYCNRTLTHLPPLVTVKINSRVKMLVGQQWPRYKEGLQLCCEITKPTRKEGKQCSGQNCKSPLGVLCQVLPEPLP